MKPALRTAIALFLGVGLATGGGMLLASDQSSSGTNTIPCCAGCTANITIDNKQPVHWTDPHVQSLAVEKDLEQSVYLTAVQIIRLERDQGDALRAIPYLERLAQRAPTQPLKNGIRRLIVDLHLEINDYKRAEAELNKIIDESLLQF